MNWFFIALIGYLLLAVVAVLDKFIVSKSVRPIVYTFYSTIFMFGALAALPIIDFNFLIGIDWWWAIISGVSFGFALWTLFLALNRGEASHINPFNGGLVTIFIFILSFVFLGENLTILQYFGISILVLASFLLSFEKSLKHDGFHLGFVWAIISALFFAISHVSAKYLYGQYDFGTAFIWTRATTGLVGLFLLLFPTVRNSFKRKEKEPKTYAKKYSLFIVIGNKILSILSAILLQYAMSIGSVTIVGAMSGVQYVLMFTMIYLLTKFTPKIFKEYFTKHEIKMQILALLLVVIGSVFFVI